MLRLCTILLSLLPANVPATVGQDIVRPEPASAGRPLVEAEPRRVSPCASLQVRVTTLPTAPAGPGQPRRIELVFRGNRLDLVWMVLPAEDRNALLRAFTTRHGRPTLAVAFGRIYLAAGAAMHSAPAAAPSGSGPRVHAAMAALQARSITAPATFLPST